jgi:nitrate/TMAO reductase-like tetraheme cytochrome c subunit
MWSSVLLAVVGLTLLVTVMRSRALRAAPGWRTLAFVAFCALPVSFAASAIQANLSYMKRVEFCGSCHVMQNHVGSLTYDDDEPLASVHYRNNYVEQDHACYACHVSYAMFGGVRAKTNGLRHVWAFVTEGNQAKIELYEPYDNANCLHCHGSSQRFLEVEDHVAEDDFLTRVGTGELSCLHAGCHDEGHYWDGKYDDASEGGSSDAEAWGEAEADSTPDAANDSIEEAGDDDDA